MSNRELHTSLPHRFSGVFKPFDQARFVVFGVPYDQTSTYRAGARFGPAAVRIASENIETMSLRSGVDLEKVPICDIGDIHVMQDLEQTLSRVAAVTREIAGANKIPVVLGGEHSITYGVTEVYPQAKVVSFDAHADFRDEYQGKRLMHATFMRRIWERQGRSNSTLLLGVRALSSEEKEFLESNRIHYYTTQDLRGMSTTKILRALKASLKKAPLYITIDMDVFDPAFAPGVSNPEPDGLEPRHVLDLVTGICRDNIVGLDIVEVCPHYDNGATAVLAAKTLFEAMSSLYSQVVRGAL